MKISIPSYIVRQVIFSFIVNIGFVLDGYTVAWTSPMIPILKDPDLTPLTIPLSEEFAAIIAPLILIASVVCPLTAYIANIIGRRPAFAVIALSNIIGYSLLLKATNLTLLFLGRIFTSISVLANIVNSMTYNGEITSPNIRGVILTMSNIGHCIGGILVISVSPYISYAATHYIPLGLAVIYFVSIILIPESPLFYVIKGNEKAAIESLKRLGRHGDINKELTTMTQEYAENVSKQNAWREIVTIKSNRKSFFICTLLLFFQQVTGAMYVIFYAVTILDNAASSIPSHLANIYMSLIGLLGNLTVPLFIERCGRRVLLIVSSTGCCVSMTILGTYMYLLHENKDSVSSVAWLPLVTMILMLFFYNVGLSTIPNTILGEMFNPNVRTTGSSIAVIFAALPAFGFLTGAGYLDLALGAHSVFWLCAVMNVFVLLFTIFCVPETKGKTLSEIQAMLR